MFLLLKISLCRFLPSTFCFCRYLPRFLIGYLSLPPSLCFSACFLFFSVCFPLDLCLSCCLSSSIRVGHSLPLPVATSLTVPVSLCICSVFLPPSLCYFSLSVFRLFPPSHPRSTYWLRGRWGRQPHPDPLSGDQDPQGDLRDEQEQQNPEILGGREGRSG